MTLHKALAIVFLVALLQAQISAPPPVQPSSRQTVPGFADFAAEARVEREFLAVPSARLAGEELKTLSAK